MKTDFAIGETRIDKNNCAIYGQLMKNTEIAKIRRWFGYDLKEMGREIGAHFTTVSMLENGKRKPTAEQAERIAALQRKARAEMLKEVSRGI